MTILKSLVMALSCFSRIPAPRVEWEQGSMRYMMCFFPLVGICIGLICWLWCWICNSAQFGTAVFAVGLTLIPIATTGGIHLDGLADCIDAQASHAEPSQKRAILKDPHSGAFAIIGIVAYLLFYFSLATEFRPCWQTILLMGCMFVASRCMSGVATITFPASGEPGMLASFRESASKRASLAVLIGVFALNAGVMIWAQPLIAAIMLAGGGACLLASYILTRTQFGGMSGDIAGAFLQTAELVMFACLIIGWKVMIA